LTVSIAADSVLREIATNDVSCQSIPNTYAGNPRIADHGVAAVM